MADWQAGQGVPGTGKPATGWKLPLVGVAGPVCGSRPFEIAPKAVQHVEMPSEREFVRFDPDNQPRNNIRQNPGHGQGLLRCVLVWDRYFRPRRSLFATQVESRKDKGKPSGTTLSGWPRTCCRFHLLGQWAASITSPGVELRGFLVWRRQMLQRSGLQSRRQARCVKTGAVGQSTETS